MRPNYPIYNPQVLLTATSVTGKPLQLTTDTLDLHITMYQDSTFYIYSDSQAKGHHVTQYTLTKI